MCPHCWVVAQLSVGGSFYDPMPVFFLHKASHIPQDTFEVEAEVFGGHSSRLNGGLPPPKKLSVF